MWYGRESSKPPRDIGVYIRIGLLAIIGIILFSIISSQAVTVSLNATEFNELFTKPLYYTILSGLILASIVLIRVDIRKSESIVWWLITVGIYFLKRDLLEQEVPIRYKDFKLGKINFVIWQVTKILIFAPLFGNLMFGIATQYLLEGNDLGTSYLPNIFSLPFITSPDPSIAKDLVIPMIPSLTLLIPPLLGAIGLRILLYIGLSNIIHVISSYLVDSNEAKPRYLYYVSVLELVAAIGLFWSSFNMFFTSTIDYNTKYAIIGTLLVGIALATWAVIDRSRSKIIIFPSRRNIYVRVLTIGAIAIVTTSIMTVNNSIADARKIEWLGPYTSQQIAVNRYFAELDNIKEVNYDVKLTAPQSRSIKEYVKNNQDILSKIRLWDWSAAYAKLKPEIGLIPYVDFYDSDILRFNDELYWSAAMKPQLPSSVTPENKWYSEHLVYTHVPNGFLMLDAHNGTIVNSDKFFEQRRIYYGEGGLFSEVWSAFPVNRQVSDELNQYFYDGKGGITLHPPMSWMFESNFLLSYPDKGIHVMRYKDIHERMKLLYPYFEYDFQTRQLDILPVTDGKNSYWLIPMIVRLDTEYVPWGMGNDMFRLVGYTLVDTYNGNTQFLVTGDDFFTNIFVDQYDNVSKEIPSWLQSQIRYPEELFWWKVNMYNFYHVEDVSTFIVAKDFYEIPGGLSPYYVFAKPPGFEKPEFLGLLSLELKGAAGKNLAGYMITRNDYPYTGEMIFYQVPLDSTTNLLGPTAVKEGLDKDPDFAQLKTLLRNPRIGDNILYRIGEQDVYFIPIYTAGAGGVVTQLGTIAAVGAAFTGDYYVGLGNTVDEAFTAYLSKLSGISTPVTQKLDRDTKIDKLMEIASRSGLEIVKPTSISAPITFQEDRLRFDSEEDLSAIEKAIEKIVTVARERKVTRILTWEENDNVNFGIINLVDGVPELRYITIEVGK